MRIQVSGKQIDIGHALRSHVESRLNEAVGKYFDRPVDAVVTFCKDGHLFVADSSVHLSTGMTAQATARADEIYASFEASVDRMEKQLRRYKRRLKDRSAQSAHAAAVAEAIDAGYTVFAPAADDETAADHPPVVAETRVDIPSASVSDAVMLLDLRDTTALLFRNSGTGRFNMVYRRGDGTIGWVEPQRD